LSTAAEKQHILDDPEDRQVNTSRMKPGAFHYHAPRTADDAVAVLGEVAPEDGRVLAGGQTLIPTMALRLARPAHLVDINRVAGFDRLDMDEGALRVGPCVRHCRMGAGEVPGPLGRLLSAAQRHIAHYPIRTRGTFCGSLANADPASEWCLVVAALDARIVARSRRGTRQIPARELFLGVMTTGLEPDELLAEAHLPLLDPELRVGFYEFARRSGDFALAMAVAIYGLRGGVMVDPRVGLGGVEPAPRRLPEVEAVLAGRLPSAEIFEKAATAIRVSLAPLDDDPYRRSLAETAIVRALSNAA
jgi:carbon-monoxide dehydrogenase medium subunit